MKRLHPTPRLKINDVSIYADLYKKDSDNPVIKIVPQVRERGYLTKDDLVILGEWKSARIRNLIIQNSEKSVCEVTKLALASNSPQIAVHIPQALYGVAMPVASTILHWFHKDPFPILDIRALWTLGIEVPTSYSLKFWEEYVDIVRQLASEWCVDMRTLDRALWQFSEKHQPAGS